MGVLQAAEAFITNKPKKSKQVADIINHIMSKNPSFVKMEEGNKADNTKNVDYWLYWDEKKFGIYAKENSEGNNNVALPYENGPLVDEKTNECNLIAFIFDNTLYLVDRRKLLTYINGEIKANPGFLRTTDNGIKWVLIMKHVFIGLAEFGYKQK